MFHFCYFLVMHILFYYSYLFYYIFIIYMLCFICILYTLFLHLFYILFIILWLVKWLPCIYIWKTKAVKFIHNGSCGANNVMKLEHGCGRHLLSNTFLFLLSWNHPDSFQGDNVPTWTSSLSASCISNSWTDQVTQLWPMKPKQKAVGDSWESFAFPTHTGSSLPVTSFLCLGEGARMQMESWNYRSHLVTPRMNGTC